MQISNVHFWPLISSYVWWIIIEKIYIYTNQTPAYLLFRLFHYLESLYMFCSIAFFYFSVWGGIMNVQQSCERCACLMLCGSMLIYCVSDWTCFCCFWYVLFLTRHAHSNWSLKLAASSSQGLCVTSDLIFDVHILNLYVGFFLVFMIYLLELAGSHCCIVSILGTKITW